MIAPLENPMAIGALVKLAGAESASSTSSPPSSPEHLVADRWCRNSACCGLRKVPEQIACALTAIGTIFPATRILGVYVSTQYWPPRMIRRSILPGL